MNHVNPIISLLVFIYFTANCTIVPPVIRLTGEKTVIERQIIGDYEELEKDAWIISSVKTLVQKEKGSAKFAGNDPDLFKALRVRKYHIEKLRNYKNEGAIGETNRGFIKYRTVSKYEKNKNEKGILLKVIKIENDARSTIFKRVLILKNKKKPSKQEINKFAKIFANKQKNAAQKKDWIQNNSGRWVRK